MIPKPAFSLQDKVVVQFGGTGLLGPGLITALGQSEATVVVVSRTRASLDPIVAAAKTDGRVVHAEESDPSSEFSLHALRDRILVQHHRVDGMVFNSTSRPMRSFNDNLEA